MSVLKSCIIAFSMYSKIPMPQFTWEEADMKYVLCFFPWVGAVIGAVSYGWWFVCQRLQISGITFVMIAAAIPLLITGGFHVDGFMDTMDAFHSYQEKSRKLEILKDSHIGAFSVICLFGYYFLYLAAYARITEKQQMLVVAAGFFLSRTLSGIAAVTLSCAKQEGMLYMFTSRVQEKTVKAALGIQLLLGGVFLLVQSWVLAAMVLLALGLTFLYYQVKCKRELGGITGDTEGYFLTLCELVLLIVVAVGAQ